MTSKDTAFELEDLIHIVRNGETFTPDSTEAEHDQWLDAFVDAIESVSPGDLKFLVEATGEDLDNSHEAAENASNLLHSQDVDIIFENYILELDTRHFCNYLQPTKKKASICLRDFSFGHVIFSVVQRLEQQAAQEKGNREAICNLRRKNSSTKERDGDHLSGLAQEQYYLISTSSGLSLRRMDGFSFTLKSVGRALAEFSDVSPFLAEFQKLKHRQQEAD